MEGWKHLLVVKKRDDEKAFIDIITGKRDFAYLIKSRSPMALKAYFEDVVESPRTEAITITFKEELRLKFDERRLSSLISDVMEFFPIEEYIILPDVDLNGNYHFHGILKMLKKDKPKMKRYMTKHVGFIKYSYISEPDGWWDYCRKTKDMVYTDDDIVQLCVYKKHDNSV